MYDKRIYKDLKINCNQCFGYCCVALYFTASEGFPVDKVAGKPCINLQVDFRCLIHNQLAERRLKGCMSYDCFGAGQKVAQSTYDGRDWRSFPELSCQMFAVFSIMRELHEMLWYLTEALMLEINSNVWDRIKQLKEETERLTYLDANSLVAPDLPLQREKVKILINRTFENVTNQIPGNKKGSLPHRKSISGRADLIGADLKNTNLRGMDLRGAFLVAADFRGNDLSFTNLIGADLRDADIRGTNLERSLFLTQSQINAAKGDCSTRLPFWIEPPAKWYNSD